MFSIKKYVKHAAKSYGLPQGLRELIRGCRPPVGILVITRPVTMMELYIETLTGTAFELKVSPFETVISVKAKIQRLEGIPVSQQHLIWQSMELDDDCCLHDYDIHSGATLKLVLALRGGPINTRRIPTEDPTLREMAEYMEANRDDIMDKLPNGGSGRQVTLLVFREGDQLNFFRVVDRGDGTLTPLPESLSAASMYNLCDEEEDSEPPTQEKEEENDRIRNKVQSLRNKMVDLSIGKQSRRIVSETQQPLQPCPPPPLSSRTRSGRPRLLGLRSGMRQEQPSGKAGSSLPPVSGADDDTYGNNKTSAGASSSRVPAAVAAADDSHKYSHHPQALAPQADVLPDGGRGSSALPQLRPSGRSLTSLRSSSSYNRSVAGPRSNGAESYPSIPEHETFGEGHAMTAGSLARERRRSSRRNSQDRLKEPTWLPQPPAQLQHPLGSTWQPSPDDAATDGLSQAGARRASSSRRRAAVVARDLAESQGSAGRLSLESLTSTEAQAVAAGLLQQASHLERLGTSTIGGRAGGGRRAAALPLVDDPLALSSAAALDGSSSDALSARLLSRLASAEGEDLSVQLLPPVKPQKKPSSSRCFSCSKKTGLATSYACRCGNNFCATHRYAELHDCTFDYKTEGRKLLEQSNPVVSAPKLPKI